MITTSPRYVPREKDPRRRRRIMGITALLVSAAFLVSWLFWPRPKVINTGLDYCSLSESVLYDRVVQAISGSAYTVDDYYLYGDALGFGKDAYQTQGNTIKGKVVTALDVCSGTSLRWFASDKIDQQIPLQSLDSGFWVISVIDNMAQRPLVSSTLIDETFYPVRTQRTEVSIFADKDLFVHDQTQDRVLADNYVMIGVRSSDNEDVYDVAIDPYGNLYQSDGTVDRGAQNHGIDETEMTYQIAMAMKEQLTQMGLRVLLVRNETEVIDRDGQNGRYARAYAAQAKYYIELQLMEAYNEVETGYALVYSAYASDQFAHQVELALNSAGCPPLQYSYGGPDSPLMTMVDDQGYDRRTLIRNTGGQALEASGFDTENGMEALSIEIARISNPTDAQLIGEHPEAVAQALSSGIMNALGLAQE